MRWILVVGLLVWPVAVRADAVGVVGTWNVTAIRINQKLQAMKGKLVFTFRQDGTGTLDGKRGKDTLNETFKWWLEADELVIVDHASQTDRSKYKRRGNTLTLEATGGMVMTLAKIK